MSKYVNYQVMHEKGPCGRTKEGPSEKVKREKEGREREGKKGKGDGKGGGGKK